MSMNHSECHANVSVCLSDCLYV